MQSASLGIKKFTWAGLTLVTLATWEVEIRKIEV
jgi:hypothetical protein